MSTTSDRKGKSNAYTRAAQFPNDFDALSETVLMCKFCCHQVDWEKKDTVTGHIDTQKHKQVKFEAGGKAKIQTSLESTMPLQDKKQEMILDFVQMMMEANIPIEKKDKMDAWLKKYVPNAGFIPKAEALRKVYVPKVIEKEKNKIKEKIKDQPLSIVIDSSPDRKARNVVNTIAISGISGEKFLLNTTFLDSVNNVTLFHTIDSVRQDYGIKWVNIDHLVCDSAKYNTALFKSMKTTINPKMRLIRCWAHLLDLISDTWQDAPIFSKVHQVTAKFQSLMNKSSPRKARYIQFLMDKKASSIKCMPTIVLSRWNTWFRAVEYLYYYIDYIKDFIKKEQETQDHSEIVSSLMELFSDQESYYEVKLLVAFAFENAKQFLDIIEVFETSKGITHKAYNLINNLYQNLRFNIHSQDFGDAVNDIIDKLSMNRDYWIKEFRNLYRIAWLRTDGLMKGYEGLDFLKAVRVFDPSQLCHLSKKIDDYKNVFDLSNPNLHKQFETYLNSDVMFEEGEDLVKWWKEFESNCPELATLAIRSLNVPVASVDVERSFSMYRDILTDKRCGLTLSSLNSLCIINYNRNFNDDSDTD